MPTTYAIPDGRTVMAATTYTGNGGTQAVSNAVNGVSFQPDFVWVKNRSGAYDHILVNSIVGANINLYSNRTTAEVTNNSGGYISAISSTGFTAITGSTNATDTNATSNNYVGWQWKAGGAAVTNTAGSITSQVSANTAAGFSVVTYTGTGANATVGHGLGVAPKMVIVKARNSAGWLWCVYHASLGATKFLRLQSTDGETTSSTPWQNTAPTSTVFSIGTEGAVNFNSSTTYVAYCWAAVPGYSAFGSYTGNGSTDGPFVYLGFRPRFIMTKRYTATGNWVMLDTARNPYNDTNLTLYANASDAESTGAGGNWGFDILSNGFKIRGVNSEINTSGQSYLYAAFAENPLKYANAR
jgi:hypothetical protein